MQFDDSGCDDGKISEARMAQLAEARAAKQRGYTPTSAPPAELEWGSAASQRREAVPHSMQRGGRNE